MARQWLRVLKSKMKTQKFTLNTGRVVRIRGEAVADAMATPNFDVAKLLLKQEWYMLTTQEQDWKGLPELSDQELEALISHIKSGQTIEARQDTVKSSLHRKESKVTVEHKEPIRSLRSIIDVPDSLNPAMSEMREIEMLLDKAGYKLIGFKEHDLRGRRGRLVTVRQKRGDKTLRRYIYTRSQVNM